jgi:class 3 adenylate cyclase/predicted ATPase
MVGSGVCSLGYRTLVRSGSTDLPSDEMSNPRHMSGDSRAAKPERRYLTVLFCDIVGSSALAVRLDPEDLRDILHEFRRCCGEAIVRYDGHLARYVGDGVLAYFGFPAAHEDDAERATNAALQMVEAISGLSFPGTPSIQIRIGIATGLVIVGDLIGEGPSREFALIGEAPNLAAALQQLAKPNQILASPQTRRLLARRFEFADLGDHPVKGQEQSVRVWGVLGASAVPTRLEAHQSSQFTPLAGREQPLTVLLKCYERARQGAGQVLLIAGDPGIGKSRLIMALRDRLAGETFRISWLQCSSYHTSSPWYPIIRHLEDDAAIRHGDAAPIKLEKLEVLIGQYLPDAMDSAAPLLAALLSIPTGDRYAPLELTPQQQKKRTFDTLFALFQAQAAQRPNILVAEDIHWIDPTSRELLEQLSDRIQDSRLLIVLSFRPEFHLAWAAKPHLTSLTLHRLESADVLRMVESLTEGGTLPSGVIDQIIAKTDGVPLFVEEVTKSVLEKRRAKRAEATADAAITVPETLHETLMGRFDQHGSVKVVAQMASAIGREFSIGLLEAVASEPHADVRTAIDRLLDAGLLYRRENVDNDIYIFKHALLQDATYASMLRDERRELHRNIAETLCLKFAETAEAAPELVANHYAQAGEVTAAIGYWLKGGRLASGRSAFAEAQTQFESALKLLRDVPAGLDHDTIELQLQQSLAMARIALKGFGAPDTMQAFDRALQLCESTADPTQFFAVLNGMTGVHMMRGEFEQSRSLALQLLERAGQQGDTTALLMGHRVLGMSLFVIGELHDARKHLLNAMELYEPSRHAPLALIYSQDLKASAQVYLGLTSVLLGEIEDGLVHAREALAHAERLRHPHSICYVLPFLAGSHLLAGMPQSAYSLAERTIALADEYGFQQWQAGGMMLRGWALLDLGEVESSIGDLRKSIDGLQATGTLIWMRFAHFLLAQALARQGEEVAAIGIVDRLVAEIGSTSGRWFEADVHRLKGELLLRCGRAGEAEACYNMALAIAARQGAELWRLRAMNSRDALWRAQGRTTTEAFGPRPLPSTPNVQPD